MGPSELDAPQFEEDDQIFKELPTARVVDVSRSERNDSSNIAIQLVYTIEFQYKQFTWRLEKKAIQFFFLHLALKKRALLEELQEKQELVKEYIHNLGFGDEQPTPPGALRSQSSHDRHERRDRHERQNSHENLSRERRMSLERQHGSHNEELHEENAVSAQDCPVCAKRDIPSSALLPVIRPAIGRLPMVSERETVSMQNYLNLILESLEIVNTTELYKFMEVSKLSFTPEYGPKLQEGYVMVNHLARISDKGKYSCTQFLKSCCCCFNPNWQQVWAVLKPGFLVLLADPLDAKPLDIIIFDLLTASERPTALARIGKERNPLKFSFVVDCGNRQLKFRTNRPVNSRDWVEAINDAAVKPSEGWCNPHRFDSYAPQRGLIPDGSEAQWYVDGRAAFDAITVAIENAESEIFMTGWWLCPELYLRRPFKDHEASRLDSLLERKAKVGVQIYVLLYKEVSMALKINSSYSKRRLQAIHENVKVLRWPDHFSSGVYLWSHHEKLVIVDHRVCFLGGLDLCYGRYDDPGHKVWDQPPTVWPGKDYYNPRQSEPNSWEDAMKDELDRNKIPRMPWHDVQCAIWGPACRDVARHFVQRWNYAKRNKAPNTKTIPLLLPHQHPHQHMVIPHYLTGHEEEEHQKELESALQQATDAENLASYDDIPLLIPKELDNSGLESRGSGSFLDGRGSGTLLDGRGSSGTFLDGRGSGIPRGFSGLQPLRGSGRVVPCQEDSTSSGALMKSTSDEIVQKETESDSFSFKTVGDGFLTVPDEDSRTDWWGSVESRGADSPGSSIDEVGEVGPRSRCKIQVIRSVGQWSAGTTQPEERSIHSAYCSLIEKAEHFVYIENQFFISGLDGDETIYNRVLQALYTRIMRAHAEGQCFRVIVVMPLLPGFQGGVDDSGAASVRFIMHWQFRTICRGKYSLLQKLRDSLGYVADDYVSFHGLRNYGRLEDGPLATSQVYVHSKLMIVDDRFVLIGSANINDRSLLGSRDSEVGVVLEDQEFVNSTMNGNPWLAGRFAHSLRLSLWAEHLGIDASAVDTIQDPVGDATYRKIWLSTAENNTNTYETLFGCMPADKIHTRATLRQAVAQRKEKVSYNTIDLGMASEYIDQDGQLKPGYQDKQLEALISGHLVNFPLNFMSAEDLRPVFKESEYYASAQIFH